MEEERAYDQNEGFETDLRTVASADTLEILGNDGASLGDSSFETVDDFGSARRIVSLGEGQARDFEPARQRECIKKLMDENRELKNRMKRRTAALDAMRKAYIVDVAILKKNLCDQAEQGADYNLAEANLRAIPSLDFRPILQLYAPDNVQLQMSPCDECGGTMEIVHLDHMEMQKLRAQVENLQDELKEAGQKLGDSRASAEISRLSAESVAVELSQLKSAMVKEVVALKKKMDGVGPEVVAKLSEERDKAESHFRLATGRIKELERLTDKLKLELDQVAQDAIKVAEMEHHLQVGSRNVERMVIERDLQVAGANELRDTLARMERDALESAKTLAELRTNAQEQDAKQDQYIEKLRNLLAIAQSSEAAVRAELADMREERLGESGVYDEEDDNSTQCTSRGGQDKPAVAVAQNDQQETSAINLAPPTRYTDDHDGDTSIGVKQASPSEKMQVLELTETLRIKDEELENLRFTLKLQRKQMSKLIERQSIEQELAIAEQRAGAVASEVEASAVVGEDLLSGAQARRVENASRKAENLAILLATAQKQARDREKEKQQLLKMWKDATQRANAAEKASWDGETAPRSPKPVHNLTKQEIRARDDLIGQSSNSTKSTSPGRPLAAAAFGDDDDVSRLATDSMVARRGPEVEVDLERDGESEGDSSVEGDVGRTMMKAVQSLEEDCRGLREHKEKVQNHCSTLQGIVKQLEERLETAEGSLAQEKKSKSEIELELEERKKLLSEATLTIAEHSMALHDATAGVEKTKAQLRSEKEGRIRMENTVREMSSLNLILETGLSATKVALEASEAATGKMTAKANVFQSRAEWEGQRAESHGMRVEEECVRHWSTHEANTKQVSSLNFELTTAQAELVRRRHEAKEHAEEIKDFRALVKQRARLEEEVTTQHERILGLEKKAAADLAVIEDLKLQVILLDGMRREVFKLEGQLDKTRSDLSRTIAVLEGMRDKCEATEQRLRESKKLVRALWTALTESLVLVDDWCSGPLLAWRDADDAGSQPSSSLKKAIAPFEVRSVDDVMRNQTSTREPPSGEGIPSTPAPGAAAGCAQRQPGESPVQAQLELLRPKDLKGWLEFRVHQTATEDHNSRAEAACTERELLDAVCRQRAAQISNMEEAIRQLQVKFTALGKEHDDLLVTKEEQDKTIVKQNEVLLDNARELHDYAVLKEDHQAEVLQHQHVARRLLVKEEEVKSLTKKLQEETIARTAAEVASKKAQNVRARAVEEREAAEHEAGILRAQMKREKMQKTQIESELHALIEAENLRLETNKGVATEVTYGDFIAEVDTQTAFVYPELTLRQFKRRAARRHPSPETVGTVCPALRCSGGREKSFVRPVWMRDGQCAGAASKWGTSSQRTKQRKEVARRLATPVSDLDGTSREPLLSWKFEGLTQGGIKESDYSAEQADALMSRFLQETWSLERPRLPQAREYNLAAPLVFPPAVEPGRREDTCSNDTQSSVEKSTWCSGWSSSGTHRGLERAKGDTSGSGLLPCIDPSARLIGTVISSSDQAYNTPFT